MSGAGKSTVAFALERKLLERAENTAYKQMVNDLVVQDHNKVVPVVVSVADKVADKVADRAAHIVHNQVAVRVQDLVLVVQDNDLAQVELSVKAAARKSSLLSPQNHV